MGADGLYGAARRGLFRVDAESAHELGLRAASFTCRHPAILAQLRRRYGVDAPPSLRTRVAGLAFDHPVGLAAGLDKNGAAVGFWEAIGFAFVEVGTVTPGEGQPGNPRPRLHRLVEDRAILNRMGFNNQGAAALAVRLRARPPSRPVGINVGKAKLTPLEQAAEDYAAAVAAVWSEASYLAVNVSSPNTPGLRDLQSVAALEPLLARVLAENQRQAAGRPGKPVFLKIAPDLADEDIDAIADLALSARLDGLIATNTTLDTSRLRGRPPFVGGISGAPLRARALAVTRRLFGRLRGRIPIIGVGGISTPDDAFDRICAGASLLQVYTALVYEGPSLVRQLVEGLADRLRASGHASMEEAVGSRVGDGLTPGG